ncbi:MAG: hypothetical protein MUC60_17475 [Oscillatoria sp. Prado101]|nr:hypothetical protein [Oscillatoria sp. Prado101]
MDSQSNLTLAGVAAVASAESQLEAGLAAPPTGAFCQKVRFRLPISARAGNAGCFSDTKVLYRHRQPTKATLSGYRLGTSSG